LAARVFVYARKWSMNSSTTGLAVRFFSVTTATGHGREGKSTGNCRGRKALRFGPRTRLCRWLEAAGDHRDRQSGELHRKPRALVVIASINPQCTADLIDKRSNYPHSHSLAGGWIKSLRQTWAVIGDR